MWACQPSAWPSAHTPFHGPSSAAVLRAAPGQPCRGLRAAGRHSDGIPQVLGWMGAGLMGSEWMQAVQCRDPGCLRSPACSCSRSNPASLGHHLCARPNTALIPTPAATWRRAAAPPSRAPPGSRCSAPCRRRARATATSPLLPARPRPRPRWRTSSARRARRRKARRRACGWCPRRGAPSCFGGWYHGRGSAFRGLQPVSPRRPAVLPGHLRLHLRCRVHPTRRRSRLPSGEEDKCSIHEAERVGRGTKW